jgi:hypothetical protein
VLVHGCFDAFGIGCELSASFPARVVLLVGGWARVATVVQHPGQRIRATDVIPSPNPAALS